MSIEYLIEKYNKLVYKVCFDMLKSSLDAEDITQEVFLSFYINLHRYEELEENDIKNIICKIALNKCRDILKSKSQKLQNLIDNNIITLENYQQDNEIDEKIFIKQRSEFISKMINEMKSPYSNILYEYYIKEMTLDEVAKIQNVSKGTLKMQLYRAKKKLKEKVESQGGEMLL